MPNLKCFLPNCMPTWLYPISCGVFYHLPHSNLFHSLCTLRCRHAHIHWATLASENNLQVLINRVDWRMVFWEIFTTVLATESDKRMNWLLQNNIFFFSIEFLQFMVFMLYILHEYECFTWCMPHALHVQQRVNRSYRWLWAVTWVPGNKPWLSGRAVVPLIHWAISSAPENSKF